jgi:hypothetical protein
MKQVQKTPEIVAKLQAALGKDVDTSNHAVFEAIGLNDLPIRKKHPIFKGAIHDEIFLREMAASLAGESVPVYLMHDSGAPTPFGRAFHGEVINNMGVSELRTLFFVDKATHPDIVQKLDNGTVDQVSVSILAKQALCSECGFDFLGPDSDLFANVLTGTDPEGHVMGENGVHVKPKGLDTFYELSLVGKGGARGARILNRDEQKLGSTTHKRLAASGIDPSIATLVASAEPVKMDLNELVNQLSDTKAKLTLAETKSTETKTQLDASQAKVAELEGKLAEAEKKEGFVKQEQLDAALGALRDVTKKVLVASGKVDAETKEFDVAKCVATIDETSTALAAKLAAGSRAAGATADAEQPAAGAFSGAYRTRG